MTAAGRREAMHWLSELEWRAHVKGKEVRLPHRDFDKLMEMARELLNENCDEMQKPRRTDEEAAYVRELLKDGHTQQKVADLLNQEFHAGRLVRTRDGIRQFVRGARKEAAQ